MGFLEDMRDGLVDPIYMISNREMMEMEAIGLDPDCREDAEMFKRCGCCMKSGCPHCSREEE